VADKVWHGISEHLTHRPCLFCIGLGLAAEWDYYHKVRASSRIEDLKSNGVHLQARLRGSNDTAWLTSLYLRLNEQQRELGYAETAEGETQSMPLNHHVLLTVHANGLVIGTVTGQGEDPATHSDSDQARADVVRIKYRKLDAGKSTPIAEHQGTCIIYGERYEPHGLVSWLPCGRIHHDHCLDKWLQEHGTCPQCRGDVVEKVDRNGVLDADSIEVAQCRVCRKVSRGHMVRCERRACHLGRPRR